MIINFKIFEQSYNNIEKQMIDDMFSRCDNNKYLKYISDEDPDTFTYDDVFDDFKAKESFLDKIYDITIKKIKENYIVSFWGFNNDVNKIIGNNPVLLYHYTSSNLLDSILKNGLVKGHVKTNPAFNSYSGVYLTTQENGNVIRGYVDKSIAVHGGKGIQLYVKKNLKELEQDPDDADLRNGKYQFITDHVSPKEIIFYEEYKSTTGINPFI